MSQHVTVQEKLEQYGIEIVDKYDIEEERYFHCEDMIVLSNEKLNSISVSFDATLPPNKSANLTVILTQIKNPIEILEVYTYNLNNQPVLGEEAYKEIENKNEEVIKEKVIKDQYYNDLMSNLNEDDFFKC